MFEVIAAAVAQAQAQASGFVKREGGSYSVSDPVPELKELISSLTERIAALELIVAGNVDGVSKEFKDKVFKRASDKAFLPNPPDDYGITAPHEA